MTRITKSVKLLQAAAVSTTKDEADNTLLDLYNSSDHTKAQSNNSAITMDNRKTGSLSIIHVITHSKITHTLKHAYLD